MKAVTFPQVNLELAKDQPQYQMLPVFVRTEKRPYPGTAVHFMEWVFKEKYFFNTEKGHWVAAWDNYKSYSADDLYKKYLEQCPIVELPEEMTACFELSTEEIAEINHTGKLWYTQMLFGKPFQPVRMATTNPFK